MGEPTSAGFVLDQPNIQVFERKPKETKPEVDDKYPEPARQTYDILIVVIWLQQVQKGLIFINSGCVAPQAGAFPAFPYLLNWHF
jgi:hypothetical protein